MYAIRSYYVYHFSGITVLVNFGLNPRITSYNVCYTKLLRLLQRIADRQFEIAALFQMLINQVGNDFGIGLRAELMTCLLQPIS